MIKPYAKDMGISCVTLKAICRIWIKLTKISLIILRLQGLLLVVLILMQNCVIKLLLMVRE